MKILLRILALASLSVSGCVAEPVARYRIRQTPPPVGTDEIVRLTKAGVSDAVIVDELKSRGVGVRPNPDQIVELKKEGVSDAVLQAMNEAPVRSGQDVVVETLPGPAPYPYYYPYYPYSYGPWWYGGPYWGWYYHYPYYYSPYYHGRGPYYGSVHPYRH